MADIQDEILRRLSKATGHKLPQSDFNEADIDPLFYRGFVGFEYSSGPTMLTLTPSGLKYLGTPR